MRLSNSTLAGLMAAAISTGILMPIAVTSVAAAEQAVAPEKNPPGDIPDTQVFIAYKGPSFSMQIPEGWSRKDTADGATFTDKYNTVETSARAGTMPTLTEAAAAETARLNKLDRAVTIGAVKEVALRGSGRAIKIEYQDNSAPNDVTGKQIRLEHARYIFGKGNQVVTVDMSAPQGADNVDQWLLMAESVKLN